MFFAQLAHVPIAEQKRNPDESRFTAGVLDLLQIRQRKHQAVPVDQKNGIWTDRIKNIFGKMAGDRIPAQIDASIIYRYRNDDCRETSCANDTQS